ncbi:MAG: 5'-nucleotidase C-terminal domain-containing protein [Pseudooceanicola sp.]|nr:5'-nucleotidase C-terminal domain-containing protein [Pseudooceanicola sp.]
MNQTGSFSTAQAGPVDTTVRLRLLATTDLHMALAGTDPADDRPVPGLTRLATLIATARSEVPGAICLLLDNGDALQGGALGELAASGDRHPAMHAFRYLGYDALGLGNHDFDLGLDHLGQVLRQAPCPVVCSNLDTAEDRGFAPSAVIERDTPAGTLRVGILSFLPPQTTMWNARHLQGRATTQGILAAARRALPELRARCDLVVALAHSGPGDPRPSPGAENAALALARIKGIDAVIGGHTHQRRPFPAQDSGGAPVVVPGATGSDLGVIDLTLRPRRTGGWRVTGSAAELRPAAVPGGALAIEEMGLKLLLAKDHARARALVREPVGRLDQPVHSYFTFFAPDRALALVAAAQAAALRPLLKGPEAALPLLSAAAPGRFGARAGPSSYVDIPVGPVAMRHLLDLQVFANDLHAVVATGAQLADWLERAAGLFHTIAPGSDGAPLVDRDLPGHDFDVIHGATCEIDLARWPRFRPDGSPRDRRARRIRDLRVGGRPVTPGDRFVVALSSYRLSGGGNVAALQQAIPLGLPPIPSRDALAAYLSHRTPRDPLEDAPPPWRFTPMPGTRVSVQTGPGARAHLSDLAGRGITDEGLDPDGFLRLRLPL